MLCVSACLRVCVCVVCCVCARVCVHVCLIYICVMHMLQRAVAECMQKDVRGGLATHVETVVMSP
jgi:hypothetical protein